MEDGRVWNQRRTGRPGSFETIPAAWHGVRMTSQAEVGFRRPSQIPTYVPLTQHGAHLPDMIRYILGTTKGTTECGTACANCAASRAAWMRNDDMSFSKAQG